MKVITPFNSAQYQSDLTKPMDISIAVRDIEEATRAWYVGRAEIEPVRIGGWVGTVKDGSGVNFYSVYFSPHAHGTHTETLGHVMEEKQSIDRRLSKYFFVSQVITCSLDEVNGDRIINTEAVLNAIDANCPPEAVILRTPPNAEAAKKFINYSNTNPPYMEADLAARLADVGIEHLLIDTPSVDKEEDGGALAAHHAFWRTQTDSPRENATISELIFVPDEISDDLYLLELQIAPIENDASPSRPTLYKMQLLE
jgi:kynurenine formamidase